MRKISVSSTLTVYYDGQFWVGVCERVEGGRYGACRVVFGAAEPTDPEILAFVCERWATLPFAYAVAPGVGPGSASASDPSPAVGLGPASASAPASGGSGASGDAGGRFAAYPGHTNPKRRQREARKLVEAVGAGTKAQRALTAAYETRKHERKAAARNARRDEAARRFALKQQKRKRKHRGR